MRRSSVVLPDPRLAHDRDELARADLEVRDIDRGRLGLGVLELEPQHSYATHGIALTLTLSQRERGIRIQA